MPFPCRKGDGHGSPRGLHPLPLVLVWMGGAGDLLPTWMSPWCNSRMPLEPSWSWEYQIKYGDKLYPLIIFWWSVFQARIWQDISMAHAQLSGKAGKIKWIVHYSPDNWYWSCQTSMRQWTQSFRVLSPLAGAHRGKAGRVSCRPQPSSSSRGNDGLVGSAGPLHILKAKHARPTEIPPHPAPATSQLPLQ